MQLDLRIMGQEVNDGMLEAIKDFLRHHEYEGEYQISIQKSESTETPLQLDTSVNAPSSLPSDNKRPRITLASRSTKSRNSSINFNLSEDRGEMFSESGKFKFKRRG